MLISYHVFLFYFSICRQPGNPATDKILGIKFVTCPVYYEMIKFAGPDPDPVRVRVSGSGLQMQASTSMYVNPGLHYDDNFDRNYKISITLLFWDKVNE